MSTEEPPKQNLSDMLSSNLQSQILEFALEIKKYDDKDYIGFCKACIERVDRSEMTYKKGHLFHTSCAVQHSGEFSLEDPSVNEGRRGKIDLVYLKNLESRIANKQIRKSSSSKKKKSSVKKSKVKKKTVKRKSVKRKKIKKKTKAKKKVAKRKSTTKRKKTIKRKKVSKKRVKRKATRKRRR